MGDNGFLLDSMLYPVRTMDLRTGSFLFLIVAPCIGAVILAVRARNRQTLRDNARELCFLALCSFLPAGVAAYCTFAEITDLLMHPGLDHDFGSIAEASTGRLYLFAAAVVTSLSVAAIQILARVPRTT